MWVILVLRHLTLAVYEFIPQARKQSLERLGQAGHDRIVRLSGFEDLQDWVEAKTGIRPNTKFPDVARHVDETARHQFHAAVPRASVTRAQFGIPEIGRIGFDTQQRIVRTLAAITRIVPDLGFLLTPENCDHAAVEIKDQTGSMVWQMDERLQQSIIHAIHLLSERVRCLVQETAQRLRIGKVRQTRKILEGTVGT